MRPPGEAAGNLAVQSVRSGRGTFLLGSLLFLHFMIVPLWGFPLTPAAFALLSLLAVFYSGPVPMGRTVAAYAFLLFPLLHLPGVGDSDLLEFTRSYLLYTLSLGTIAIAASARLSAPRLNLGAVAIAAMAVIGAFSAAQSGLQFLTGSTILYNPFGSHQYLGAYSIAKYVTNEGTWSRAPALYLEPSFAALVLCSLLAICYLTGYKVRKAILIFGVTMFFNRSFTGIGAFVLMSSFLAISGDASRRKRIGDFVALTLIAAAGFIALRGYIIGRLLEFGLEGGSAYYRTIAPLVVLRDVLLEHPLGLPFGSMEKVVSSYHLLHGGMEGTGIDNGAYILVYYFGWIGLAGVMGLLFSGVVAAIASRSRAAVLFAFCFVSLWFSGGILLPEYAFLICLVIYQFRSSSQNEKHAAIIFSGARVHPLPAGA